MAQLDLFVDPLAEWRAASFNGSGLMVGPSWRRGVVVQRLCLERLLGFDGWDRPCDRLDQAFILERWHFGRCSGANDYSYRRRVIPCGASTYEAERAAVAWQLMIDRRELVERGEWFGLIAEARRVARRRS